MTRDRLSLAEFGVVLTLVAIVALVVLLTYGGVGAR
jgi:hypothetical protein